MIRHMLALPQMLYCLPRGFGLDPRFPKSEKSPAAGISQLAGALELPFVLVGGVLAGGGLGYLGDRWLHTAPLLMLAGGAAGFGAAIRDILKRLSRDRKKES